MRRFVAIGWCLALASFSALAQSSVQYNNQGITAYDAGNYPLAINLFEQAYNGAPENATVRHNLCNALQAYANALAKESDYATAVKQLETAIGVDPENPSPFTQLGAYYLRMDHVQEAIQRLETAVELKPGEVDAHELLGRAYYADNDPQNAILQWDYVLEREPTRKELKDLREKAAREAAVESDFKRRGSKHFTVSYPPAIAGEVRARVMSLLEGAYQTIGMKFGKAYPPSPIQVVTYGPGQFQDATKLDDHVGAVFDGKIRIPLTDKDGKYLPDEELKRRLTHEYVHVVIRHLADMNVPWWVNEGFAETFSSEIDNVDRETITKAAEAGKLIKLADLQDAQLFRRNPEDLTLAYSEAQIATNYLWTRFGSRKLAAFMADLGAKVPAETALKTHYGRTLADLDREIAGKFR